MSAQRQRKLIGVLANVDYDDPLTWFRAREVLIEARRRNLVWVERLPLELLADAFYAHYREPVLRRLSEFNDERLIVWYKVLSVYLSSQQYRDLREIAHGNAKMSRLLAIRLLRVYIGVLSKVERNDEYKTALYAEVRSRARGEEPVPYIKSVVHRLEHDIRTEINFVLGRSHSLREVLRKTRSVLGNVAGDEVAEILLEPEDEATRIRLTELLRALIELAKRAAADVDILEKYVDYRGFVTGIKKLASLRELRDLTPTERARLSLCREIMAYKLSTASLIVRELRVISKPKLYMLIDKSGSMFYSVDIKVEGFEYLNKITWATALALAILLKGGHVVVRFFDKKAHEPLTDKTLIVRTLLQLTPLGGTSITNALRAAINDALKNPALRNYKLVLITDGEDSNIDVNVLLTAQSTFRDFIVILVGGENYLIEKYCKNIIKLKSIGYEALKRALRHI